MDSKPSQNDKKERTAKEAFAHGVAIGREWKEKWLPRRKSDHSVPKWKIYLKKIGFTGWILIGIVILILYGYIVSLL